MPVRLFVCLEWPQYGCIRTLHLLRQDKEMTQYMVRRNTERGDDACMLMFLMMLEMSMDADN